MKKEIIIKLLKDCYHPIKLASDGNHDETLLLNRISEAIEDLEEGLNCFQVAYHKRNEERRIIVYLYSKNLKTLKRRLSKIDVIGSVQIYSYFHSKTFYYSKRRNRDMIMTEKELQKATEEIICYECMSCGNIQSKNNGFSCNKCCAPVLEC